MAKEVVQYCLTMFVVLGMSHTYGTAFILGGMFTTVLILTMLVLTAIDIPARIQRLMLNLELEMFTVFI